LSRSCLTVTNRDPIAAVEVGVRLNHPRLSDLALSLVSPSGTRVLLQENRGGASGEGMGLEVVATNITPISSEGGPAASTNAFDTGETAGTITIDYDFYSLPDTMHIYYEGQLIFDSGLVSGSTLTNISYGPGTTTSLSIIMNEGDNFDTNTAWFYTVTSTRLVPLHLTFTDNTNLTLTPIKFAPPPFTNLTSVSAEGAAQSGIFYLPEESLRKFTGQSPTGLWQLEIADARPGATDPTPVLVNWELRFTFNQAVPLPVPLPPGQAGTNTLGPGQIQWYVVETPAWASFATNRLLAATAPLHLLFNPQRPPTGTNSGDVCLLQGATAGQALLQTNAPPALLPGTHYYLGLQNTNPAPVTFTVGIDFDVAGLVTLSDSMPYAAANAGTTDYYRYVVSSNAVRAQFELQQPTADLTLVLRHGLPLPSLTRYDWLSANPGTNDELIVCYDFSSPVALAPGEWFLAVLNPAGVPAAYSILATETATYGTNLDIISQVVTDESVCITWASLPGTHYFVQGSASVDGPNWVTLSPTVTAADVQTTFCLPLAFAAAYPFLRVQEGLVLTPPALTIQLLPQGRLLQWTGSATNQFQVQWADSLPPVWNTFPNIITSTTSNFFFLDDGSQSGGLGSARFYRLLVW
ncbi:MAG TPA: proprotein convertase P-domain-containing protein, partial [Bacillota bacterium]|nr:proprotein convertase P-domain-containing protein [Bacillota bacterium]